MEIRDPTHTVKAITTPISRRQYMKKQSVAVAKATVSSKPRHTEQQVTSVIRSKMVTFDADMTALRSA
jgi:hypothetical protein